MFYITIGRVIIFWPVVLPLILITLIMLKTNPLLGVMMLLGIIMGFLFRLDEQ